MPQSVVIGLLVLGGVLLLVAVTGGNFKIFGAEVESRISSAPVRFLSGLLGALFILLCLGLSGVGSDAKAHTGSNASSPAPDSGTEPSSASTQPPKTQSSSGAPARAVTSKDLYAVVFDPPSNVRVAPVAAGETLCAVTAKTAIRILGSEGNWYKTDICDGRVGYIHRSQVKF
jgi:hypothetical protein